MNHFQRIRNEIRKQLNGFKGVLIIRDYRNLNSMQNFYDFSQMYESIPLRTNRLIRNSISHANLLAQKAVAQVQQEVEVDD